MADKRSSKPSDARRAAKPARGTKSAVRAGVDVVGAPNHPLRDAYHSLLKLSWAWVFGVLSGAYLGMNALFAMAYMVTGGVENVRPASFRDAFFFSVQTMGTIGYGKMVPETTAANVLVVAESVVGLFMTAIATGVVFARFSQSSGRLLFSDQLVIGLMNGVPTLMFRIGNERSNVVVEATIRVSMVRTERTAEGTTFYRMSDLKLSRDRSPALARSWTVLHPITSDSPLFGATPESFAKDGVEFMASVVGTDDTSLQPVHARHTYDGEGVRWGARLADILTEKSDGTLVLDVRRFHDVAPTTPTPEFPYPR